MQRDSFIFYRSFYEAAKELNTEQKADLFSAICEYSLNGEEIELSGIPKAMFGLMKPNIDANNRKYENGKKGGRPRKNKDEKPKQNQTETKQKPKNNQEQTESKPNVDVNDNVDVNGNVDVNADEVRKSVCEYFGITEVGNANTFMQISTFMRGLNNAGQLEIFKNQFSAYCKFREVSKAKWSHSPTNFIFKWNEENWMKKLEDYEQANKDQDNKKTEVKPPKKFKTTWD